MSPPHAEMSCQELVELVTEYLEGSLPESARACFEEHLAVCEGCERYLAQMRETVRLLGRLSEDSLSTEAMDRLMTAFRTWKARGEGSEPTGHR